jgi:hypothetical protein
MQDSVPTYFAQHTVQPMGVCYIATSLSNPFAKNKNIIQNQQFYVSEVCLFHKTEKGQEAKVMKTNDH